MPVSPARAAAFDILLRVERESSYTAELLHSSAYEGLSTSDHALLTELVMGVLRWRSRLDDEIAGASSQRLSKLDVEIVIALRLALYQFGWLNRVPKRAALHESVELVKRARKRSAAPFVNAVLRKLSGASTQLGGFSEQECVSAERLAMASAHPVWLVERWAKAYGLAVATQICKYDQSTPATNIRLRRPTDSSELKIEGVILEPGGILSSARRVQSGDVTKTRAVREGQIVIQDEASQLVAALVRPLPSERVRILDACAAPGGKTLAIADRNPGALVIAAELHLHRARRMQQLLSRSIPDIADIRIVVADARQAPFFGTFDVVLADVPCSGTGTLARNPEIKWRITPADLTELHKRQVAILRSVSKLVTPVGRVIYATCSLEKEENEDVVEEFLSESRSFRIADCRLELDRLRIAGDLRPDPSSLLRGPYLRTIPGVHPGDGFFAAILEAK